jgi:hypothetical protein
MSFIKTIIEFLVIIIYKGSLPSLPILIFFLGTAYLTGRPLLVWRCIGIPCLIIFLFLLVKEYIGYTIDKDPWAGIFFFLPWVAAISLYGIAYLLSELIRFGILFFRSS